MTGLRELCAKHTGFTEAEITELEELSLRLQLMADVSGADLFIDIPVRHDSMLVVAQAGPKTVKSAYNRNIVGEMALRENEPAVFRAFETGVPFCDIRALTQEGRTVRQNTAPITNKSGDIIGVLVREKDISDILLQEKKYEELARSRDEAGPVQGIGESPDALALREMHHRIKNSLQLIASILNMQARKTTDAEAKMLLRKDVERVLSIASIHDILTHNPKNKEASLISSRSLLEKLGQHLSELTPPGKNISFQVSADEAKWRPDTAESVALIVNELVTNAFIHAFEGLESGSVTVSYQKGILFHTVTVSDSGTGFEVNTVPGDSIGLNIARATVHDKLHGRLRILSGSEGTKISFDFKEEMQG